MRQSCEKLLRKNNPPKSKISNATRSEPPRLRRWGYQGSRACLHLRYQNLNWGLKIFDLVSCYCLKSKILAWPVGGLISKATFGKPPLLKSTMKQSISSKIPTHSSLVMITASKSKTTFGKPHHLKINGRKSLISSRNYHAPAGG